MPSLKSNDGKIVVFFDGYCGLCNGAVDFLILRDKQNKFIYSPLQGEYIKTLKTDVNIKNLETLYVFDGQIIYEKTLAWRLLATELGGVWKWLAKLSFVLPLFVCDKIYDFIAKHRYKFFGRREVCRRPTAEEQKLFLP